LPDFSGHNLPKREKIYQIVPKLPIGHKKVPNGLKDSTLARNFPFQGPQKYAQNGIFGTKVSGNLDRR
jgi:hypothetical protein